MYSADVQPILFGARYPLSNVLISLTPGIHPCEPFSAAQFDLYSAIVPTFLPASLRPHFKMVALSQPAIGPLSTV